MTYYFTAQTHADGFVGSILCASEMVDHLYIDTEKACEKINEKIDKGRSFQYLAQKLVDRLTGLEYVSAFLDDPVSQNLKNALALADAIGSDIYGDLQRQHTRLLTFQPYSLHYHNVCYWQYSLIVDILYLIRKALMYWRS